MAALVGACVGFLPYNLNPAKMFMGDTGATFLGFILSTMSIQGLFKFYAVISFAVPFLILGLPIFDTAFAMIRRMAHGQSPMHADRGHIHHRLIDMGLNQKQAVATLYVISGILGLSAVVLTTGGEAKAMLLLIALCVVAVVAARVVFPKEVKEELHEELEELNCVREDYSDGATGIGPEELDLIIDLCNGREIPTDRRLSLLRAIHHIKDTQIERSILESINGSDSRISKFLDEAEQMGGAAPDSD